MKPNGDGLGRLLCAPDFRYIDALYLGVLQNLRQLPCSLLSGGSEQRFRRHAAHPFRMTDQDYGRGRDHRGQTSAAHNYQQR
jgi:hypothetical protein